MEFSTCKPGTATVIPEIALRPTCKRDTLADYPVVRDVCVKGSTHNYRNARRRLRNKPRNIVVVHGPSDNPISNVQGSTRGDSRSLQFRLRHGSAGFPGEETVWLPLDSRETCVLWQRWMDGAATECKCRLCGVMAPRHRRKKRVCLKSPFNNSLTPEVAAYPNIESWSMGLGVFKPAQTPPTPGWLSFDGVLIVFIVMMTLLVLSSPVWLYYTGWYYQAPLWLCEVGVRGIVLGCRKVILPLMSSILGKATHLACYLIGTGWGLLTMCLGW